MASARWLVQQNRSTEKLVLIRQRRVRIEIEQTGEGAAQVRRELVQVEEQEPFWLALRPIWAWPYRVSRLFFRHRASVPAISRETEAVLLEAPLGKPSSQGENQ